MYEYASMWHVCLTTHSCGLCAVDRGDVTQKSTECDLYEISKFVGGD